MESLPVNSFQTIDTAMEDYLYCQAIDRQMLKCVNTLIDKKTKG